MTLILQSALWTQGWVKSISACFRQVRSRLFRCLHICFWIARPHKQLSLMSLNFLFQFLGRSGFYWIFSRARGAIFCYLLLTVHSSIKMG